jgi:4'-phosphopantetheinyl transferase
MCNLPDWRVEEAHPLLRKAEIHLWRVDVLDVQGQLPEYRALLSNEERARSERLRFEKDRNQFVAAHAVLRILLQRYVGSRFPELPFVVGPHGKPQIDPARNEIGLEFNLSHSHGLVLLAFSKGIPIGVDVEKIRETAEIPTISARFFSASESEYLRSVSEESRAREFCRIWARREAAAKSTGLGLGGLPDDSCLDDKGGKPGPEILQSASGSWLNEFVAKAGYCAALVAQDSGPLDISYFQFP